MHCVGLGEQLAQQLFAAPGGADLVGRAVVGWRHAVTLLAAPESVAHQLPRKSGFGKKTPC